MTTEIHGFCDERFAPLREAFLGNFKDGLDIGASLGVTHRGKMVVDLWGGFADRNRTRAWQDDTIVQVFSTSKIMTILMTLMLVDRGLIELDAPVARYWPDFAQGGKQDVTIRDALTHQAGVPGFATPVPFDAMHHWDELTARIAAEPHWFEGRKLLSYHFQTYGPILGEVLRRVDGRMPARFLREEVMLKCGADYLACLTDRADVARVAGLQFNPEPYYAPGSVSRRAYESIGPGDYRTWERMSADLPSANGYGNGRSIARVCAIFAMGGALDGVRYLKRALVEEAASEQIYTHNELFGWIRLGLGFGLDSADFPAPSPAAFHWGGYGGSWGVVEPKAQISLGFAPNNLGFGLKEETAEMALDHRLFRFRDALETVLAGL